jgi:hypothetical protein
VTTLALLMERTRRKRDLRALVLIAKGEFIA